MDRATWAQATVAHLTTGIIPVRYGSPAFFLYPGNPQDALRARTAAMLVAAECWALDEDDLESRLAYDVAQQRRAYLHREREWQQRLDEAFESYTDAVIWPMIAKRATAHARRGIERS